MTNENHNDTNDTDDTIVRDDYSSRKYMYRNLDDGDPTWSREKAWKNHRKFENHRN